ncbi:hypothetical protein HMI56_006222 [Coelomomyces lativittatus]|nr:hypothetical protein HMI56_006222 [Coelomomyces lativittatus]
MAELKLKSNDTPSLHDVHSELQLEQLPFNEPGQEEEDPNLIVTVEFAYGTSVSTSFVVNKHGHMKEIFETALKRFKVLKFWV